MTAPIENYKTFAEAIVNKAIEDYQQAVHKIKTTKKDWVKEYYQWRLVEIETFIISEWCELITNRDIEILLDKLHSMSEGIEYDRQEVA